MRITPLQSLSVCWRIGAVDYVLMRLYPQEFARQSERYRGLRMIPQFFTVHDRALYICPRPDAGQLAIDRGDVPGPLWKASY